MTYDAIVVGGGHNGLICAAYLARGGLRVVLLEAREELGGMARLAGSLDRLAPQVATDLDLAAHGLELTQSVASVFAPRPDGGAVTLWNDPERTAAEIGGTDGERYVELDRRLRAMAGELALVLANEPPSMTDFLAAMAGSAAMRTLPMPVTDLVGEWFESDALQAAIAWRGLVYTGLGPRMPGTAGLLVADAALSGGGLAGRVLRARGGPGAMIDAMAASLEAGGGEIRSTARVARVRREGRHVLGVTLVSGEEIDAPVVVSALDPQMTLLDMLEPEAIGPRLSWRAANIRQTGATARVEFKLSGAPQFPAAGGDVERLGGRIVVAPSMRYLELAMRPARYAAGADDPLIVATLDDGHLTAAAQAAAGSEIGDAVTRTLERHAPGFGALIVERRVMTPADLAREYGIRGGHPLHAEAALDQSFAWRPMHELGRHRLPLDGYYLAGSGAHPGGGVTGLPGRLAAQAVLQDGSRA